MGASACMGALAGRGRDAAYMRGQRGQQGSIWAAQAGLAAMAALPAGRTWLHLAAPGSPTAAWPRAAGRTACACGSAPKPARAPPPPRCCLSPPHTPAPPPPPAGSKSKRQTLKQKYKILRKVKEHHRKKRREERKAGHKKKEPKDPGIPKQWPFKEELVAQLQAQREAHLARERTKRDERRRQKVRRGGVGLGRVLRRGSQRLGALRRASLGLPPAARPWPGTSALRPPCLRHICTQPLSPCTHIYPYPPPPFPRRRSWRRRAAWSTTRRRSRARRWTRCGARPPSGGASTRRRPPTAARAGASPTTRAAPSSRSLSRRAGMLLALAAAALIAVVKLGCLGTRLGGLPSLA